MRPNATRTPSELSNELVRIDAELTAVNGALISFETHADHSNISEATGADLDSGAFVVTEDEMSSMKNLMADVEASGWRVTSTPMVEWRNAFSVDVARA